MRASASKVGLVLVITLLSCGGGAKPESCKGQPTSCDQVAGPALAVLAECGLTRGCFAEAGPCNEFKTTSCVGLDHDLCVTAGCTYSVLEGCTGTKKPCSEFQGLACPAIICLGGGYTCRGTARACETFGTLDSCYAQEGCRWE